MGISRDQIDDIVIGGYCGLGVRKVASEGQGEGRPRLSCRGPRGGLGYSLVDVDVGPRILTSRTKHKIGRAHV